MTLRGVRGGVRGLRFHLRRARHAGRLRRRAWRAGQRHHRAANSVGIARVHASGRATVRIGSDIARTRGARVACTHGGGGYIHPPTGVGVLSYIYLSRGLRCGVRKVGVQWVSSGCPVGGWMGVCVWCIRGWARQSVIRAPFGGWRARPRWSRSGRRRRLRYAVCVCRRRVCVCRRVCASSSCVSVRRARGADEW